LFQIRVKDYEKFDFPGATELAAMFDFYQQALLERDIKMAKRLNPNLRTFDKWLDFYAEDVEKAIKEHDDSQTVK